MSLVVADFAISHQDHPEYRERLVVLRRRTIAGIAAYFALLQSTGLVRTDADADQLMYGEGFETVLAAAVQLVKP